MFSLTPLNEVYVALRMKEEQALRRETKLKMGSLECEDLSPSEGGKQSTARRHVTPRSVIIEDWRSMSSCCEMHRAREQARLSQSCCVSTPWIYSSQSDSDTIVRSYETRSHRMCRSCGSNIGGSNGLVDAPTYHEVSTVVMMIFADQCCDTPFIIKKLNIQPLFIIKSRL